MQNDLDLEDLLPPYRQNRPNKIVLGLSSNSFEVTLEQEFQYQLLRRLFFNVDYWSCELSYQFLGSVSIYIIKDAV